MHYYKNFYFHSFLILLCLLSVLWGWKQVYQHKMILDEKDHYSQIEMFYNGDYSLYARPGETTPKNATFPGFHLIAAYFAKIIGYCSPEIIRIFNIIAGILSLIAAYFIARELCGPDIAFIRAMQVLFLPILFSFSFLIYTESLSLLMLLIAFFACIKKRPVIAGVFAFIAVMIRQNNIVFVLFLIAYNYVSEYSYTISLEKIKKHLLSSWMYILTCVSFLVFAIINKGVALNKDHCITFSMGNVLFSLFLCLVLFIPVHISGKKNIEKWITKNRKWFIFITLITIIAVFLYNPSHRYNRIPWLLRNEILNWLVYGFYNRIVFTSCVLISIFSLVSLKFSQKEGYLLYPFWFLILFPHLLVEPRYYIVPFVMLILFRKRQNIFIELSLLIWFALIAFVIHHIHTSTIFVI